MRLHRSSVASLCLSASTVHAFLPHRLLKGRTFRLARKMSASSSNNVRVALCQFHVTENKQENLQTCADYLDRASQKNAELVVLPEIWNSPYATAAFPEYAEHLDDSPSSQLLQTKAQEHKLWIIGGSIPEVDNGYFYNTCLVFNPQGKLVAKHRKVHLFDIDVPNGIRFFESDTLSPGNTVTTFTTPWCTFGVGICYDIRFPEYAALMRQRGCKVLVYPGAFNMTTGPAHWELLQRARAVDSQCFVVTASPARATSTTTGKYPPYVAWGHSTATAPWGTVLATTEEKEALVVVDLDLTKVDEMRQGIPVAQQKRKDMYELQDLSPTRQQH